MRSRRAQGFLIIRSFGIIVTLFIFLFEINVSSSYESNSIAKSFRSSLSKLKRYRNPKSHSSPTVINLPDELKDLNERDPEFSTDTVSSPRSTSVVNDWLDLETVPKPRVSAKLHSEVVLECVAVGSPPPQLLWLKNGKSLDSGAQDGPSGPKGGFSMSKLKSKLPIRCIRPEDEGDYSCVAVQIDPETGGVMRKLIANTHVVIEEDDESEDWKAECEFRLPYVFKKGKRGTPAYIHAAESLHMEVIGSNLVLPCRSGGKPQPRFQWLSSDGEPIDLGKKFQVNSKGDLLIKNLSWDEMGEYKCHVENSFGSEISSTFLYPLLPEDK